jgi:hypothetical protein
MKKLLFLLFVGLLTLTSCDKPVGTVSGTVTYFYNDFIGYKPDVGATVYVTTAGCDLLSDYLDEAELSNITGEPIDSVLEFDTYRMLSKILKDSLVATTNVNGLGEYTIDLPEGNYRLIFKSVGRKRINLVEFEGRVEVERVKVEGEKITNESVKFDM